MKKICLILLCGMLLAGCSVSGVLQEPQKTHIKERANKKSDGGEVEILAEYTLSNYRTKHVMVVKNHSGNPVDVSTSSLAYSEDGTILGEADAMLYALGAGCTSVLSETFDIDTQLHYYETDITASTKNYGMFNREPADLSYIQNDIAKGAVFQVTNNGTSAAEGVGGDVLFFKGEELVDHRIEFFGDVNLEIKSGKTISKQVTSNEDFDRIELYLTGWHSDREDKKSDSGEVEILAEYILSDDDTTHVMVVKNHSGNPVDVSTSSLAYSEDGTILGEADASLYALGAGCTSVLSERFNINTQVDYCETDITASTPRAFYKEPADLSYIQNDIEEGAVFQVTNNGTKAAQDVKGHALFFKGEELVDYKREYFSDVDSEIKSGKVMSRQVTSNKDFDRMEFYLTGEYLDREDERNEGGEVEILAEYTLSDYNTTHVMVVKNHSGNSVNISTSSLAYSEDGTVIGASDTRLYCLGAGGTSVLSERFDIDTQAHCYETDITASTKKHGMFKAEPADLSYMQNDIEKGAVFQVTNNGTSAAEGVGGDVLFFKGEELVDYKTEYFRDLDSEIKPGKTISEQVTSYKDFDRIEFYLTGRYEK